MAVEGEGEGCTSDQFTNSVEASWRGGFRGELRRDRREVREGGEGEGRDHSPVGERVRVQKGVQVERMDWTLFEILCG